MSHRNFFHLANIFWLAMKDGEPIFPKDTRKEQDARSNALDESLRRRKKQFCKKVRHPFWYLVVLATHPPSQGNGHGRFMLHALNYIAEKYQHPCFLEAHGEKNIAFYNKAGYTDNVIEKVQCPHGEEKEIESYSMIRWPDKCNTAGVNNKNNSQWGKHQGKVFPSVDN